jgi:hypothetical protein
MTGTLVLEGTPPATIPSGAGAGKVATSDSSGNISWQEPGALGGVTVTGTPTAGEVLTATSGTAADWQSPAANTLDGVTVTGTPSQGEAIIASSGTAGTWKGIFGTRPEWFGTISGTSGDEVAINAAITAVANGASGCPGPVVISQPCGISNPVVAKVGVNMAATGQGNRLNFPDTFTGGYIFPSSTFSTSGSPLIQIGTTVGNGGNPLTNPCGIRLDGICLSGLNLSSVNTANLLGIQINDTADVHMIGCFLAGFDRTGSTGTAVQINSATAGNGVGFNLQNSVISDSYQGVYTSGAGVTDMRYACNLWHSCTAQLTLGGSNLGGGGAQITNDHFTYTGMPSGGYHISIGSQGGDFMVSNCYFDQAGTSVPVQLASAKGLFNSNHFLAAAASTSTGLVKLTTSGSQELTFCSNDCNGNGSGIKSLLWTSAHSGTPTGGIYVGNGIYGTATSVIGVLVDSGPTAIAAASTSSVYVAGNCVYS